MEKVRNRFPRIMTGIFVPAVVFAFIVSVLVAFGISLPHISPAFGSLPGFMGLIFYGWILGGAQCTIYSVLMEFAVNPMVTNKHLLVSISGLLVLSITWSVVPTGFPLPLLGIGFIVGCLVGHFLQDMYKYYA